MQYTVLLIVLLIVGVIVILLNFQNLFSKKRLIRAREDIDTEKVFLDYFSDFEKAIFYKTWNEIALAIGVPSNKLSPTDTISDFVKTMHLPETYLENLEVYFTEQGLNPSNVDVRSPLKDVVRQIMKQNRRQ